MGKRHDLKAALVVRAIDLRTSIRPTVAEVDLDALLRNLGKVRRLIGNAVAIYGVVKADAYGHGAVRVGLALQPHVDALAVSLVEEGLELRDAGVECPILVLGAYYDAFHAEVVEADLTPVIYDRADLQHFAGVRARRGQRQRRDAKEGRIAMHVKIDTGMHRLGLALDDVPSFLDHVARLPRVRIAGLCTHLASADAKDPAPTHAQLRRFTTGLAATRARGMGPFVVHAANSAATVRFAAARFDAVRPGIALFGAMSSPGATRLDLEPVLSMRTRIMAVHDVPIGGTVSYGGLWRAQRPSRVATLPVGYADGYPRHVKGAEVLLRERRIPLVGAVCMDMFMVDVTDVPRAAVGDEVTLIGKDGREAIGIDDLAGWAGTANYEILCGISKRVPRSYRGGADRAR